MAQLYPPYIEGTIPAFYGDSLTVPFSMNRAVSINEIYGYSLKIKTVQNNTFVKTVKADTFNKEELTATFDVSKCNLTEGQSYKIQLAYIDSNDNIGYYSTVGVVKYTYKPNIYIEGMTVGEVNNFVHNFIGVFNHEKDPTEKEYSYQFILYDNENNIVKDTGTLLHNSNNDTTNKQSQDEYILLKDLDKGKPYFIQYIVTTNNNMVCKSPRYRIMQRTTIDPENNLQLKVDLNNDNGYVVISLKGEVNSNGVEQPVVGAFLLSRCDLLHKNEWDEVFRFTLQGELPSRILWRDFTVEQGKTYIYSIQQYNDFGLYSSRILSEEITVDFEDAFLFDGERQLKIKYNPQVSSFKADILESKMDTIGSKYPFIFRNGNVNYKEFPLSGLISYWSDEEELFLPIEDLGLDDVSAIARETTVRNGDRIENTYYTYDLNSDVIKANPEKNYSLEEENLLKAYKNHRKEALENVIMRKPRTTTLEGYNIVAERIFKLEVLDWLNNGKPKLFRSPTEGNYIVRLMNTSFSPNTQLNRMLHTFSSTAYEIAECNYTNLNEFGFLHLETPSNERLRWSTISFLENLKSFSGIDEKGDHQVLLYDELLRDRSANNALRIDADGNHDKKITTSTNETYHIIAPIGYTLPNRQAQSISFEGATPGTAFYISYKTAPDITTFKKDGGDYDKIIIGITGSYTVNSKKPITSVVIETVASPNGSVEDFSDGDNPPIIIVQGSFTYSYYSSYQNKFNLASDVTVTDIPARQFIGENNPITYGVADEEKYTSETNHTINKNVISSLTDVRTSINKYYDLLFQKRPVHTVYLKREEGMIQLDENGFSTEGLRDKPLFYMDNTYDTPSFSSNDWDEYAVYKIIAAPIDNHTDEPTDGDFHRGEYYYIDRQANKYYAWEQMMPEAISSVDDYTANTYYTLEDNNNYILDDGFKQITYFKLTRNSITDNYELSPVLNNKWQENIMSTTTDDSITWIEKSHSLDCYSRINATTVKNGYDKTKNYYRYPLFELTADGTSVSTLNKYDQSIDESKMILIPFSDNGYTHLFLPTEVGCTNNDIAVCEERYKDKKYYYNELGEWKLAGDLDNKGYERGIIYYKQIEGNYQEVKLGNAYDIIFTPGSLYEKNADGIYFISQDKKLNTSKTYYITNEKYFNAQIKNRISDTTYYYYCTDKETYQPNQYYIDNALVEYGGEGIYYLVGVNAPFIDNITYCRGKKVYDETSRKYITKYTPVSLNEKKYNNNQELWKKALDDSDTSVLEDVQLYIRVTKDKGYWNDTVYYKRYNPVYIDGLSKRFISDYSTKFYYNLGIENISADIDFSIYDNGNYNSIDLEDRQYYELENVDNIHDIYLSPGVMLTIAYQTKIIDYNLENTNESVKIAKDNYDKACKKYRLLLQTNIKTYAEENVDKSAEYPIEEWKEDVKNLKNKIGYWYNIFIQQLEKAIKEYSEEEDS